MLYSNFFKRFLDLILTCLALLFLSPIILFLLIWLTFANKGTGALFFQERPGKDGKIFKVVKFKTMTDDDYDLFMDFLDYHFQEGSLYFIREWRGNSSNVEVFKLHEQIYANFEEACKSCDERLKAITI